MQEIADTFNKAGYTATVRQSTRGSKNATIVDILGNQVNMVKVHPGGGRHGLGYTQITGNNINYKIVDGSRSEYAGNPDKEKATFFFLK